MEAYVNRYERCFDSYGANRFPKETKRRLLELSFQYLSDAQRIDLQESVEITIESLRERETLIRDLSLIVKQIFPEIRLYKCIARELVTMLIVYAMSLRTGLFT